MEKITEVTYQDIKDIIINGVISYNDEFPWEISEETIVMPFNGKLHLVDFLNRLYDLENLPSNDGAFKNAYDEIKSKQNSTQLAGNSWVFDDSRFGLFYSNGDETFLLFLCEMFHPAVRDERKKWKLFLGRINDLLRKDGYELYASQFISGRSVYSYREYVDKGLVLIESRLFTYRYSEFIRQDGSPLDMISDKVTDSAKRRLCEVLFEFDEPQRKRISRYDSLERNTSALYSAISRLSRVLGYDVVNFEFAFGTVTELDILASCFTPYIFDLIELQNDELSLTEKGDFQEAINNVFFVAKQPFRLTDRGLVERMVDYEVLSPELADRVRKINEVGVKELLEEAIERHMGCTTQDKKYAVEKIWDAFERAKTVYPGNKKQSVETLILNICDQDKPMHDLLEKEFKELTDIGNDFRIRHHETNTNEITALNYYDYLFNRCLALLSLVIQYC